MSVLSRPEQLARDPAVQRAMARRCPTISALTDADIEEIRRLTAHIPREAPLPEIVHAKQGSPEARARQSASAKRRWASEEERKKQSLLLKRRWAQEIEREKLRDGISHAARRRAASEAGKAQLDHARHQSHLARGCKA